MRVQISIDLFVMAQAYVDLASLRDLCHQTAGQLYHYCPFVPEIDADQLQNDLRWNVIRPQVGTRGAVRMLAAFAGIHALHVLTLPCAECHFLLHR